MTEFMKKRFAAFLALLLTSVFFGIAGFNAIGSAEKAFAAETTDITGDLTAADWGESAGADLTWVHVTCGDVNFKTKSTGGTYWNDNGTTCAAANDGCDIMEYILVNGVSARQLVNDNANGVTSYKGTSFPHSLGGVYTPVTVLAIAETGDGFDGRIQINILREFAERGTFTLTFRKGFKLVNSDDNILTVSRDVTFSYINGVFTKTVESFEKDITNDLTAADWGEDSGADLTWVHITCGDVNFKTKSTGGTYWNDNGTTCAAANDGCDIMEYILVNGVSARQLVNDNANGVTSYKGTTFPHSLGGVYTPVTVLAIAETGDGFDGRIQINILREFAERGTFTLTFRKGFKLVNSDGDILTLSKNVTFSYVDGAFVKTIETEKKDVTVTGVQVRRSPEDTSGRFQYLVVVTDGHTGADASVFSENIDKSAFTADKIKVYLSENDEGTPLSAIKGEHIEQYIWGQPGAFINIADYSKYNGATVYKIVIEEGCKIPAVIGGELYTFTVKEKVIYLNDGYGDETAEDGAFLWSQAHTLTFGGTEVAKDLSKGKKIGKLPAVPEVIGKVGYWTIDGQTISEETAFAYETDKTATAAYIDLIETTVTGVQVRKNDGETHGRFQYLVISAAAHAEEDDNVFSENMLGSLFTPDKIKIYTAKGGESVSFADIWGGYVEQNIWAAKGLFATIADYGTYNGKTIYKVVIEQGCVIPAVANGEFKACIVKETAELTNVNYGKAENAFDWGTAYTLSFGEASEKDVFKGYAIGELPAIPAVEGKEGYWTLGGNIITSETVYSYEENKTAEMKYATIKNTSISGVQVRKGDGETYGRFQYLVLSAAAHADEDDNVFSESMLGALFTPEKVKIYLSKDGEGISFAEIWGGYVEQNIWTAKGLFVSISDYAAYNGSAIYKVTIEQGCRIPAIAGGALDVLVVDKDYTYYNLNYGDAAYADESFDWDTQPVPKTAENLGEAKIEYVTDQADESGENRWIILRLEEQFPLFSDVTVYVNRNLANVLDNILLYSGGADVDPITLRSVFKGGVTLRQFGTLNAIGFTVNNTEVINGKNLYMVKILSGCEIPFLTKDGYFKKTVGNDVAFINANFGRSGEIPGETDELLRPRTYENWAINWNRASKVSYTVVGMEGVEFKTSYVAIGGKIDLKDFAKEGYTVTASDDNYDFYDYIIVPDVGELNITLTYKEYVEPEKPTDTTGGDGCSASAGYNACVAAAAMILAAMAVIAVRKYGRKER